MTEVMLGWTHNSSNAAESFTINCTDFMPAANTFSTVILDPRPTVLEDQQSNSTSTDQINNTFAYSVIGLEAYTNYSCTITARNVFGWGPTSETIHIETNSAGITYTITHST